MGSGRNLGVCVRWMIGSSGDGGRRSPAPPRHSIVPSPHLPLIFTFEPPEVVHNAGVRAQRVVVVVVAVRM
ncbi:hypothetical protein BDN71DRAFT_1448769 [Pleurotus eryngii]|uniref:Uncharacterized protein n=1 Tax=Pleurotus eryngii TaxID=5323 RepID=A0A9P6DFI2_PLEER|nr:hypothetical protein BDN71DRAFT_1448769 [Pleurotus eryngii]